MRKLAVFVLLVVASAGYAQSKLKQKVQHVDSVLARKYNKVDYDTTYLGRSSGKLGLKVWGNLTGLTFRANGNGIKSRLTTDTKATASIEVSYYDLALEVSFNPASWSGKNKDFEINLNYFLPKFSVEVSYQDSKTMHGHINRDNARLDVEKGWTKTKTLNASLLYIFNNKHFSLDAPFYQLYRQKQSAGSFLAGISYQGNRITTTDEYPIGHPVSFDPSGMRDITFYSHHIGIGGGYAYNWVPSKHWLLHASLVPSVILWQRGRVHWGDNTYKTSTKFPTFLVNGKVGVVYFIDDSHFIGANGFVNSLLKREHSIGIRQSKWMTRVFFGMRI